MPRILIVEDELLLGAGIKSLLTGETDLDLLDSCSGDEAELAEEIRRLQPNVIILDQNSNLVDLGKLMSWLDGYPELRVVLVNANLDLVEIYDKRQVVITQVADFIATVKCGYSPGE